MQPEEPTALDEELSELQLQPEDNQPTGLASHKVSHKKSILFVFATLVVLTFVAAGTVFFWYNHQLTPISKDKEAKIGVVVEVNSSSDQIAKLLEEQKVIRSARAFGIYARISGTRGQLQAGSYELSPAASTREIVDILVSGKVDQFEVTFLPGATVVDAREVLVTAGYDGDEVDVALVKQYDHPVFAGKPVSADLEGYIYGETYSFAVGTSVEDILKRTFDELYDFVQQNSLESAYRAQGFTLYEGITLASIIQREVSGAEDQKKAAQVFIKRLNEDMPLGSDATFIYAAKVMGVEPTVGLDSPYNTRIYGGLTPGPISTPSDTALLSVAQPADTDYLYFINGDDGINYFVRTLEEHEANIINHCTVKCSLL